MTIGIDARLLGTRHGGIGRYVLQLVKNLLQLDTENNYVIFYNQDAADIVASLKGLQAAKTEFVPVNIRHYSLGEQLSFHRLLNKYNLDLVHFPNFNVPLFYNRPFVVTIHDMVHHKISGHKKSRWLQFFAYKKIIQSAADRAQKIITVSEYSKGDIVKLLRQSAGKINVVYEGVNLPSVNEAKVAAVKKTFLLNKPYFLFVGVLERKKNVVSLTRGFDAFIKKYGLDMDLVVAGPADKHYPDIKHHALDIKNNDRLIFTGYVEDGELAALYQGAYAFVSASLHEGFGLPGVEAMRFGLPLAASNIAVFNEIYDNAAVYFNPLDPEDIADKLRLLAQDQNYYRQTQAHSLARGQLFDWRKTAEQTLNIYSSVLKFEAQNPKSETSP